MIDKRIKYRIVIDTETCPLNRDIEQVTPDNMWVYDCGWAVVDKKGNIYRARSFINADIFLNEKIALYSAYYNDKIPMYWTEIRNGSRQLTSFYNIRQALLEDINNFGVTEIYAHNMRFDLGTLNNTQRWLTKSKYRYFFPKGIAICDTLKMARDVIGPKPTYQRFCANNGYLTANGKPRFTAEIIYRYITQNIDFIESHTGLEDVLIEKEIMAYCFRQKKKMRKLLFDKK